MRSLLLATLFLTACCAPSVQTQPKLATAAQAVVKVMADPHGGYGSGFVIRSTELESGKFGITVVTAKHVTSQTRDFEGYPKILGETGTVVAEHVDLDVALVYVVLDHAMPTVSVRLKGGVKIGEDLYAMGYSGGHDELWVTHGVASSRNRGAAAVPGDSGGPMFDQNGNVVGIIIQIDVVSYDGFTPAHLYHHCQFVPAADLADWFKVVL